MPRPATQLMPARGPQRTRCQGRARPAIGAAVVIVGLGGAHAVAAAKLDAAQLQQVGRWKVISHSESVIRDAAKGGKAAGRIAAPPEAVLYTLLELGTYQHFVPRIASSRLIRRKERQSWAWLEADLPWPVADAQVEVRVEYRVTPDSAYRVRWEMVRGTMKHYFGWALISPWKGAPYHSLVTLFLVAEPHTAAPRWLISRGVRKAAAAFVHGLRMRTVKLQRDKQLPADLHRRYRKPAQR